MLAFQRMPSNPSELPQGRPRPRKLPDTSPVLGEDEAWEATAPTRERLADDLNAEDVDIVFRALEDIVECDHNARLGLQLDLVDRSGAVKRKVRKGARRQAAGGQCYRP